MRHPSHSKLRTRAIDSLTHSLTHTRSHSTQLTTHARTATRAAHCSGAREQRLFAVAGRGGLHARAGEALGTFDVARSEERAGAAHAWRRDGGQLGAARPSRLVPVALTARNNVQYG